MHIGESVYGRRHSMHLQRGTAIYRNAQTMRESMRVHARIVRTHMRTHMLGGCADFRAITGKEGTSGAPENYARAMLVDAY